MLCKIDDNLCEILLGTCIHFAFHLKNLITLMVGTLHNYTKHMYDKDTPI